MILSAVDFLVMGNAL